jgi:protoporphyrinogen oxidase
MTERWGIVGGGILGMTLAQKLARAGHDVTILEGAPHLGGLASAWQLGDVVWDRHYHVTLYSDLALRALLADLSLGDEVEWVTTQTGFYVGGKLYPFNNILDFLRFPPLNPIEKARLGATILYASRLTDWRALERITALEWLRRLSGQSTVDKVWHPLLRAKLGPNAEKASAGFIWATIRRMYAARRSGLKKELFGYVRGGYARVLERFAAQLEREGVHALTGARVEQVVQNSDGGLSIDSAGVRHRFDRVVITAAAPIASRLCPQLPAAERTLLENVEYQGIVCASLLLDRPLSPYYVTNITDTWVPFTAVIEMSALVDRAAFGGKSLIYLPKYVASDDPALAESDDALRELFIGGLERMYPSFDRKEVRAFQISRVRYVLPISTVGYSDRLPPMHTSIPGLHIVNNAHILNGTLNVNETVTLANRAAEELLGQPARLEQKAMSIA